MNRVLQQAGEARAVKDVVSEHQAHGIVADELLPYDEGLREPVGGRLFGILETDAEIASVPQQPAERRKVVRG